MSVEILQEVESPRRFIDDYRQITPEVVEEIKKAAQSLEGSSVVHINATAVGGGVAEMLRSEVPLLQDLGIDAKRLVISPEGANGFFDVTKKLHNMLQGQAGELEEREKETYFQINKKIAEALSNLISQPDILIAHDPQPAAVLSFLNFAKPVIKIWRGHIDTTAPNPEASQLIYPHLQLYDHLIFSMPEYVPLDLSPENLSIITPFIDPLAPKNELMDIAAAKEYMSRLGIDPDKPTITQVSRLDPWKDPLGVIDAYRLVKQRVPDLQLIFLAQAANDDPEGERMRVLVENYIGGERGIFLLINLEDNERAVNALQTGSDIVIQKSIREGFGLTVTEAMRKGKVVIGGNVGGIKAQIQDGVNGFLVNSVEETAQKIIYVLDNLQIREKIGQAAHESVESRFLLPHITLRFLKLFKELKEKKAISGVYQDDYPFGRFLAGFN